MSWRELEIGPIARGQLYTASKVSTGGYINRLVWTGSPDALVHEICVGRVNLIATKEPIPARLFLEDGVVAASTIAGISVRPQAEVSCVIEAASDGTKGVMALLWIQPTKRKANQ